MKVCALCEKAFEDSAIIDEDDRKFCGWVCYHYYHYPSANKYLESLKK